MKSVKLGMGIVAIGLFFAARPADAQQPFSNVQSSPTTSPYLALTNRNGGANGFAAYQNYVLPQLQQQETNLQQQQQIQHLQQQQQKSLVGGAPGQTERGISSNIRGTGHVTAFMDYLHYYSRSPGGQRTSATSVVEVLAPAFPWRAANLIHLHASRVVGQRVCCSQPKSFCRV